MSKLQLSTLPAAFGCQHCGQVVLPIDYFPHREQCGDVLVGLHPHFPKPPRWVCSNCKGKPRYFDKDGAEIVCGVCFGASAVVSVPAVEDEKGG